MWFHAILLVVTIFGLGAMVYSFLEAIEHGHIRGEKKTWLMWWARMGAVAIILAGIAQPIVELANLYH